ncbi:hypothetical protein [Streptacidiphilus rugosus]|uniref:hypothetical protein n=1 Tax=Streptacidiphilus rugosus TaxID=405783 RepID=UPI00068EED8F|nr:hypothetical protein [Streptacidiphilus rugosus]
MTDPQQPPLALRLALGLHPAGYRAEHGAELTAIFAESTADAGRLGVLREALDLAGHAVRRRTGLGSDRKAGQVAAQAAPLAAAVAGAGAAAGSLLQWTLSGFPFTSPGGPTLEVAELWTVFAYQALGLAVLVAVWAGRWTAARLLALLAPVVATTQVVLMSLEPAGLDGAWAWALTWLGSTLLTSALLLAAPRDLLGRSGPRRRLLLGTVLPAFVPWAVQLLYPYRFAYTNAQSLLWVLVLFAALLLSGGEGFRAPAVAAAVLPAALRALVPLLHPMTPTGVGVLLLLLLAGVVAVTRTVRGRAGATPPTPA